MSIPRRICRRVPNLVPIGAVVWSFPWLLNLWSPTPEIPPGVLRGDLDLAYVHSQMNPQTWTKLGANRSSCLTASPDFWMFDPIKPPSAPLVSRRAICLAYIHSQMNLHMCAKFGANLSSRWQLQQTWNVWPSKPPPPKWPLGYWRSNCI